jgi:hypothetical protein
MSLTMSRVTSFLALPALLCACGTAAPFEGLAPAAAGPGPKVVFDPLRQPLAEIPFPNDIATRPDPASATGLRVNASLVAGTTLERDLRGLIDQLDGFGNFSPITVAFDAELDFNDLFARQNDTDPTNDGIYLIDMVTGAQVRLDFNGGHYPLTLSRSDQYFLNDPLAGVPNLLFPISGPFANLLHPDQPQYQATPALAAHDLMTFYERSTHTLIARPVLPLEQRRRYAVLLTNKLRGMDGNPVRSPFSGINHVAQTAALRPVLSMLPAGVSAKDIAFAWTFTTQTTTLDLEAIHDGLHGSGVFSWLRDTYPVYLAFQDQFGQASYATNFTIVPLVDAPAGGAPGYLLPASKLAEVLADPQVANLLIGTNPAVLQALLDSLKYVDYFVAGWFLSPDFLADADRSPFDTTLHVDAYQGYAGANFAKVPFFIAVPKQLGGHFPPFPTAILGHGYKSNRFEGMVGFAGTFAKFGVASVAIDAYGHGLEGANVDPLIIELGKAILRAHGLGALGDALFTGRARDLNNDGIPDSGGDFWTADPFHTRDVVRQSVIDWMQLVRILRTFDGRGVMALGAATPVAGDFNGDGIPDLGGVETFLADVSVAGSSPPQVIYPAGTANPGANLFVFGQSLGGILCGVLPAVEPTIKAAACGSTAGGLSDVVVRSTETNVVKAALLEILGPILATCGWDAVNNRCGTGPQTLVFNVQDVNNEAFLPIAPLQLAAGDRVTVLNLTNAPVGANCNDAPSPGCFSAVSDAQGRVRNSVSADWPTLATVRSSQGPGLPDKVAVTVVKPGDPILVRVEPADGSPARVISSWEMDASFHGVSYAKGTTLTAPARGYGYQRNTPDLRRLVGLSQMMLASGDPISYAAHWFKDPLPLRAGVPANVLLMETSGDTTVPIATGLSLGRAAGLIEQNQPDSDYGLPMDQILIQSGVAEGIANLSLYADPTTGPRAALGSHIRCDAPGARCDQPILLDPSGFSCDVAGANCTDGFGAPRLNPPLREQLQVTTSSGTSALILEYISPTGSHSFLNPQPQKAFDADLFFANMVGRYFETLGTEVQYHPCQQLTAACPWIPAIPP